VALSPSEELVFDEDDLAPAAAVMGELAAAGRGWVNFRPEVEGGHERPPKGFLFALFSGRGEAVPLATWSTEGPNGRYSVGITHGSGPRALARLADADVALPPGWLRQADHPRRGLVATTPGDADLDATLWWMLTASHVLSEPPLTGAWQALVYRD